MRRIFISKFRKTATLIETLPYREGKLTGGVIQEYKLVSMYNINATDFENKIKSLRKTHYWEGIIDRVRAILIGDQHDPNTDNTNQNITDQDTDNQKL